jgi:hypothetical protein
MELVSSDLGLVHILSNVSGYYILLHQIVVLAVKVYGSRANFFTELSNEAASKIII